MSLTDKQRMGAGLAFVAAAGIFFAVRTGSAPAELVETTGEGRERVTRIYLADGGDPEARWTRVHAFVNPDTDAGARVLQAFGMEDSGGGDMLTRLCHVPGDGGDLPAEWEAGMATMRHLMEDEGPCTDRLQVVVYASWAAPWRAACGPGCRVAAPDGGWTAAPPGNRYLAPGTFQAETDGGLPAGCYRRPESVWAAPFPDGTPPECLDAGQP